MQMSYKTMRMCEISRGERKRGRVGGKLTTWQWQRRSEKKRSRERRWLRGINQIEGGVPAKPGGLEAKGKGSGRKRRWAAVVSMPWRARMGWDRRASSLSLLRAMWMLRAVWTYDGPEHLFRKLLKKENSPLSGGRADPGNNQNSLNSATHKNPKGFKYTCSQSLVSNDQIAEHFKKRKVIFWALVGM